MTNESAHTKNAIKIGTPTRTITTTSAKHMRVNKHGQPRHNLHKQAKSSTQNKNTQTHKHTTQEQHKHINNTNINQQNKTQQKQHKLRTHS